VVVLFLALLAAALELAQHWIPGRHSPLIDFVASSVGAGLGIVALAIKDRWYLLPQRPWFTPLSHCGSARSRRKLPQPHAAEPATASDVQHLVAESGHDVRSAHQALEIWDASPSCSRALQD
jgi:hypothetical protein